MMKKLVIGLAAFLIAAFVMSPVSAFSYQSASGEISGATNAQQYILVVNDRGDFVSQSAEGYIEGGRDQRDGRGPYNFGFGDSTENVYQSIEVVNVKGKFVRQAAYGAIDDSKNSQQYVTVDNTKRNGAYQIATAQMHDAKYGYQDVTILNL